MIPLDNSRRDFLKLIGLGTVALTLTDFKLTGSIPYKARIGLQLYTVRASIERDFEKTVGKIADMGFFGIEYYPLPTNITPEHAGKVFKNVGLKVLGIHSPLPIGQQRDVAVRLTDAFDCDRVIYPGWPEGEKYKTVDATKQTMEVYNETAAFLKTRGLRFGLHNHWWEFEEADGIYPFYYLLEHLDKGIFFEIDPYWAKTRGQDPAEAVEAFGQRAPLLHIKDGPAIKGERMYEHVPAGEGSLNFHAIAKAGGQNTEWMVVEFDEYDKDIFDGIAKSYSFLTQEGLAQGKV